MTITEILQLFGEIKTLSDLLQTGNGEQRWNAFQEWQNRNPAIKEQIDKWIELPPEEAFEQVENWISKETNLPLYALSLIDRNNEIRDRVKLALSQIQALYTERKDTV